MTTNKQLREQAESVMHWSSSLTAAWPSDPDFNDAWTVGTIDEDGNKYPVIEVDADQYDAPGDSERLARFFAAANPAAVLALLDSYKALQAECEKLRKDVAALVEGIARCRHQASYFIGNEEALKNQLSTVRYIANEVLIGRGAQP